MKIVILGVAALTAGVLASRPAESHVAWSELLDTTKPAAVWLVFDPINCRITASTLARLEEIRNQGLADVRAVLVNVPVEPAGQARILRAFQTDLPVQIDQDKQWWSVLDHYQFGSGIVVVARLGKVEAIGVPDVVNPALRQILGEAKP